jgi:hypothetical protein
MSETAKLNPRARPSRATWESRGRPCGSAASIALRVAWATARPSSPPHAQEEALGQELAHQAGTVRAQGQAHGHLAAARGGTGELQARHVGAREQEHERDRAHEQGHGRPQVADRLLLEGHDADAPARVCLRVLLGQHRREPLQVGLGLLDARAALEPSDDVEEAVVAGRTLREAGRREGGDDVPRDPGLGGRAG